LLVYNAMTDTLLKSVPMPSASWNLAVDLASHDVYVTDVAASQNNHVRLTLMGPNFVTRSVTGDDAYGEAVDPLGLPVLSTASTIWTLSPGGPEHWSSTSSCPRVVGRPSP
jgi:DNA-binding beta-propeller fold protein YncE